MTDLPERVTLLGGAIALQGGEWLDTSAWKYECHKCGSPTDTKKHDYPPICPSCCGGTSRLGGTRNMPYRRRDGHNFRQSFHEGGTRCQFCGLRGVK